MEAQTIPSAILAELTALANPPIPENYLPFLTSAISSNDLNRLVALASFLYSDALPLSAARQLHAHLVQALLTLPDSSIPIVTQPIFAALSQSMRSFVFEQSLIPLRDRLSTVHEAAGDPLSAANALSAMPFDILAALPEHAIVRYNLRTAKLYLAAANVASAEPYLNRASTSVQSCTDLSLREQHRFIHAEWLHAKRRFADAASKYHQLSHASSSQETLQRAVICAILAAAGPRRSRILATLFADERVKALEFFPLLECIHMERLLSPDQVERFRSRLGAGQEDGVLDSAVMEHNLLATSRVYADIGFTELGQLLGVSPATAERTAAKMIYEDRMKAIIDQVEGVVRFSPTGRTLLIEKWDAHIASLCSAVDDAVEAIVAKFPQFEKHVEV